MAMNAPVCDDRAARSGAHDDKIVERLDRFSVDGSRLGVNEVVVEVGERGDEQRREPEAGCGDHGGGAAQQGGQGGGDCGAGHLRSSYWRIPQSAEKNHLVSALAQEEKGRFGV